MPSPMECLLIVLVLARVQAEIVYLHDATGDHGKRSLSGALPTTLQFHLPCEHGVLSLTLEENTRLNANAPIYTHQPDQDGVMRLVMATDDEDDYTSRFYQDRQNHAYFEVQCRTSTSDPCERTLTGSLLINGLEHSLEPLENTGTKRGLDLELGTAHYLRKVGNQPVVDTPSSGEEEDSVEFDSKTSTKPSRTLLQNLLSGLKMETDRLERQKRSPVAHGVEIIVVMDYPNYYRFLEIHGNERAAKRNARKYAAHIVNGVDLRFGLIEDPELSFYVTISGIYVSSRVNYPAETGAPGGAYDVDEALWQTAMWAWLEPELPEHDHVTLLSSNDMQLFETSGITGYAYGHGTCRGYGISVVEDTSFFSTATTLAHELGHSLGAPHDSGSGACDATKRFIMTPSLTRIRPRTTNTEPWHFSPCSVNGFRNNIAELNQISSNCMLNQGQRWSEEEWSGFTRDGTKLTGQMYSLDEQCQLLVGKDSYFCSNNDGTEIVCRGFGCYQYGRCPRNVAAPGTPCGGNNMCYKGVCVPESDVWNHNRDTVGNDARAVDNDATLGEDQDLRSLPSHGQTSCIDTGRLNKTCEELLDLPWTKDAMCTHLAQECCQTCS